MFSLKKCDNFHKEIHKLTHILRYKSEEKIDRGPLSSIKCFYSKYPKVQSPLTSQAKRQCTISSPRKRKSNNLIFSTLSGIRSENLKKMIKFVLSKIILPLFFFAGVSVSLIYLQIFLNDYCFYPNLCACENKFTYIYTLVKEIIHNYGAIIMMLYYGSCFATNDFWHKFYVKIAYILGVVAIVLLFSWANYQRRQETIISLMAISIFVLLFGISLILIIFLALIFQDLSAEFVKKVLLASALQLYLLFNRFCFKSYIVIYMLEFLHTCCGRDLALNLFKLLLMFYYIIYEFLSKMLLFLFFKKIGDEKSLSYNIVIFSIKLISIDSLSTKTLNILTMPLNEYFSWICFIFYFYSLFLTYSRTNVLFLLILKCFQKLFNPKPMIKNNFIEKRKVKLVEKFKDMRAGCIFEANLIVFLRILCFRIWNYFIVFTNGSNLYESCSLKEKLDSFQLFDTNIILVMIVHTIGMVIMAICIYGFENTHIIFNYHIEEINFFGRMFFFIICFSYVDYALQMYKTFDEMN